MKHYIIIVRPGLCPIKKVCQGQAKQAEMLVELRALYQADVTLLPVTATENDLWVDSEREFLSGRMARVSTTKSTKSTKSTKRKKGKPVECCDSNGELLGVKRSG